MLSGRVRFRIYVFRKKRAKIGANRTRKPVESFGDVTAPRERHAYIAKDSRPCRAAPVSAPVGCIESECGQQSAVELSRIIQPLHHGFDTRWVGLEVEEIISIQVLPLLPELSCFYIKVPIALAGGVP